MLKSTFEKMAANMHFQMVYFAQFVDEIEVVPEPDVTVVRSTLNDDTFNYVIRARFTQDNLKERVAHVLAHFRSRNLPFSWWVGESDTPKELIQALEAQGLSMKEDDIGMALDLEKYNETFKPTLEFRRADKEQELRDFAHVFAKIGGNETVYDDLYSKLPPKAISGDAPYQMFVAYDRDEPVLTGLLVLHADAAGIYYVMTVPEHRKKGYGTQMMHYLLHRAKSIGYQLSTLQASSDGRRLYERLGYKSLCRFVEYA